MWMQCSSLVHSAQILLSATEGSGEGESRALEAMTKGNYPGRLGREAPQPPLLLVLGDLAFFPAAGSELIACL